MTNLRNSKYIERYEDVVFELDNALIVNDAVAQKKSDHRFVVDNTGERTPFDWYNARFNVQFKVVLDNGGNIAVDDHNGIVNSSHSLVKDLNVKMSGISVYDCSDVNHATNIKNLLEYSQGYVNCQGSNEFFYLDTNRNAEERELTMINVRNEANNGAQAVVGSRNANYNKGFAARKALLGASAVVNTEIPLNRYGFFESLYGQLLPNSRFEIIVHLEKDNDLIWQAGANCRVVLHKFQLIIPRIIFNGEGEKMYMENFIDKKKQDWIYLREIIQSSMSMTQQSGSWRITTGINKPRHVFVFIINDASVADATAQTNNKFLYNTFAPGGQRLNSCHLEVGNGKDYPEVHYDPRNEMTRVFRDVLKYVHANNDYAGDTLLNRTNFQNIFSFVYFDLTKQPLDVKDGSTKLVFKYSLSAIANAYTIYSLVLYEQDVEINNTSGKLTLKSM